MRANLAHLRPRLHSPAPQRQHHPDKPTNPPSNQLPRPSASRAESRGGRRGERRAAGVEDAQPETPNPEKAIENLPFQAFFRVCLFQGLGFRVERAERQTSGPAPLGACRRIGGAVWRDDTLV